MSELNQNKIANLFSMDTIDSCNPTNAETKNECWGNKLILIFERKQYCFHLRGWLGKIVIKRENFLLRLILFNLNVTFILTFNLSSLFFLFSEDVQKHC